MVLSTHTAEIVQGEGILFIFAYFHPRLRVRVYILKFTWRQIVIP